MNGVTAPEELAAATQARLRDVSDSIHRAKEAIRQGKPLEADTPLSLELRKTRILQLPAIARELDRLGVRDELASRKVAEARPEVQRVFEAIINTNDMRDVWFLQRGAELRRTVARIDVRRNGSRRSFGTGFLVGPNLLMTNHHVLDLRSRSRPHDPTVVETAPHSWAEFEYEASIDGVTADTALFELAPDQLLLWDDKQRLDYVLVALKPSPRLDSRLHLDLKPIGYNRLAGDQGKIAIPNPVYIIQHPRGETKKVALDNNKLLALPRGDHNFLYYEADTDEGSSGSPVFNAQWEVVALHHVGGLEEDGIKANEGVRISKILADIKAKAQNLAVLQPGETIHTAARPLLEEMLQWATGVPPAILNAPVPQRAATTIRRSGFARPD